MTKLNLNQYHAFIYAMMVAKHCHGFIPRGLFRQENSNSNHNNINHKNRFSDKFNNFHFFSSIAKLF